TSQLIIEGDVSTITAGVYTLKYSVSDAAGNEASVTRIITVQEEPGEPMPVKPVVTAESTRNSVTLTWYVASDESYTISQKAGSSYYNVDITPVISGNKATVTITGLSSSTSYTFRVIARLNDQTAVSNDISIATLRDGGGGGSSRPTTPEAPVIPTTPAVPEAPVQQTTPAAPATVAISLTNGLASKDGKELVLSVKPYIENGRTMVGVRDMAALLNVDSKDIVWDAKNKAILIKTGNKEIELVVGRGYAVVNGEKVEIDVTPQIKDGRTVLPIAHIARILGMKIEFDAVTKEARLSIE
ncbi:MAG: N-acetylmuramoyl-L-alanine amidase, partial [Clostridia bacterium]|nr:N-acetylmuramoyl-L-alanine amidase [Clostridia bacterium]